MIIIRNCSDRRADMLAYHGQRLSLSLGLQSPVVVSLVPDLIGAQGGYMRDTDGTHRVYIADTCQTLTAVLAHELRHAWQDETNELGAYQWNKPYAKREHEKDASKYATDYSSSL